MTYLLIDLDGTMVDPAEGLLGGYRIALAALGRPAAEDEDLRWVIGPPLRISFAQVLGGSDRVEEALAHYRAFYAETGLFQALPYPDIHAALTALKAAGSRLLVCTSKPRDYAARVLAHFGLMPFFDAVYGAELGGRFDDKGDLIAHILEQEGLDPGRGCMIGDRKFDVGAAQRHAMRSIGVLWGYGSREELVAAGATRLCDRPAALPAIVAELAR